MPVSELTTSQDLSPFSISKGHQKGHQIWKPLIDGDRLLSVRSVAELLSMSTATVYKLCEQGKLAHVRVLNAIRVAPMDLLAFVERARK